MSGTRVRCAIYTRKSSEEGLEQDFNSLDAQREACAAYVLSQASEGWVLLPDIYDDGGISGGTLERPALQRLLGDVAEGRIDTIVVYKVDRLTRSLLDFSKLVEAFDKADTSFVSVTQSFNTTTSMGRLTLNMLLSFAQFEREVTAERIRDKIAASKAKGMWMGGTPPLGYRPDGRSLAIVEDHASIIRDIFRRYLEVGNVPALLAGLTRDGITAPTRTTGTGRTIGGGPFVRGPLYHLLKNPIYVGDIPHRDLVYRGTHPAIIDRDTWTAVQTRLSENTQGDQRAPRQVKPSVLAGLIVDEAGETLLASHACKGKVRYRYYIGRRVSSDEADAAPPMRIPAREIESAVFDAVASAFDEPLQIATGLGVTIGTANIAPIIDSGAQIAKRIRGRDADLLIELVDRVRVLPDRLDIALSLNQVVAHLQAGPHAGPVGDVAPLVLTVPVRVTRAGHVIRLVLPEGQSVSAPIAPALVKLIVTAQRWWAHVQDGETSVSDLARQEGKTTSYISRVLRMAFLSPAIVEAILAGAQPAALDVAALKSLGELPMRWDQQALAVGVGANRLD